MSNNSIVRIAIVDDNESFRHALKFFIEQIPDFEVEWEASNGAEFIAKIELVPVDIALVDIKMPVLDGIQATYKVLEKHYPYVKIIAISLYNDFDSLKDMIKAGASGYIQKDEVDSCLEEAIRTVMNNKLFFGNNIDRLTQT
jgi:DNA-binding NarL/FixJ family response regulator